MTQMRTNITRHFSAMRALFWTATSYILLSPSIAFAAQDVSDALKQVEAMESGGIGSRPILLILSLVAVTLVPFVGMMVTSFVKIAVVLSIVRQAIGTQQAPPTTVITGLSILLTIYVMHPVGLKIYRTAEPYLQHQNEEFFDKANIDVLFNMIGASVGPIKEFLKKEASDKNIQMFHRIAYRLRAPDDRADLSPDDLIVLVPSFVISELAKAFQIGFIVYLPFLVVDMTVANVLMALGMQMLSPTTISLPFKILLFVMVDGWYLITRGLVLGYQ